MITSSGAIDAAVRLTSSRIRILAYHAVSPHDLEPALFRAQLAYIARRFDTFWVSEVPALLDGTLRARRPPLVMTFDDGLANFGAHAAPALREHGIKATLYAVSDLLDGKSMLWNHELLCRLLLARDATLPAAVGPLPAARPEREAAARRFIGSVKRWPDERKGELLATLRRAEPAPRWEPWMLERYRLMGGDELRALPDVVEIGSHSRTHPILPRVDDARARDEIAGSRAALEALLGRPVQSFAYPNGDFTPRDLALVAATYPVAVNGSEALAHRGSPRHALPRIPEAFDMTTFVWRMIRPAGGG
jgi:peptidoglycan/xylan/chitin deacetylase (PgdA/CDA1 family)